MSNNAIEKICRAKSEHSDKVEIKQCGNYYTSYPVGLMDAGTKVYDLNGNYVRSCGGYMTKADWNKQKDVCRPIFSSCSSEKTIC